MKDRSLVRQTIGIVLTAQVLCALALSGFTLVHEAHAHLRAFDALVQGRSDSLLGAIQDAEDINSSVHVDPAELKVPREDVFAVYNRGGALLGSSPGAPEVLVRREGNEFRTVRWNGVRYRVLQREAIRVIDRAEFGGVGLMRPVTILYASPENHVWHAIFEAVSYSLVAIFVGAVFTTLLVGFFLQRALSPLSELAKAASLISLPSLGFEPPASVLEVRELRPLAEVLTESAVRLRRSFQKEQQFLGDAAHELKTAVAVVRSSIQVLMLKHRSIGEYESGLERILDDHVRTESLIASMLQLTTIGEAINTSVEPVDLGRVACEIAGELQGLAAKQEVEIQCRCFPDTMVLVSRERARALTSNLVMNAIQHSSPGATVAVSVERCGVEHVALKVIDFGAGIGEAALPHIFDRFYREDRSRSRDTGGTGLGLSICKAIVDSAGGTISATSTPGAGTRLTVVLGVA